MLSDYEEEDDEEEDAFRHQAKFFADLSENLVALYQKWDATLQR